MAKKSKSAGRSFARKKADEKLFLKLLQNEATKKRQQGKQTPVETSGDRISRNNPKPDKKGKRQPKKLPTKGKVLVSSKANTGRSNAKSTKVRPSNKRAESGRLRVEPQKRGAKRIDFSFEKVRAIDKKINLFKEGAGAAIKKELKKRGGKPPRGIIVTVIDKKGREKTEISPLDFVVNAANVEQFVANMLERMKADFMEWKDMEDEPGDDTDVNPYADYNPDTIASITIKFIV